MHAGDERIRDCWIKHDRKELTDLIAVHIIAGPEATVRNYDLKLVMGLCTVTIPGLCREDIENLGNTIRSIGRDLPR